MHISIVILSYNSKNDLKRLLPSIFQCSREVFFEVIIVDNGSKDGILEWLEQSYKNVQIVENINNGFAKGNNLGIKKAKGEYVLILNPDTELQADTLLTMKEFMDSQKDIGISTCKVLLPNGKLDLACRRRFPNPINSFKRLFLLNSKDYNFLDKDINEDLEIDTCMGAFMFVRKEVFLKIGLFDEEFFMYGEDIDLCFRAKKAGYRIWYFPKTAITHYKGSSSRKTPFRALMWFYDSMWIFYKKHYYEKYPKIFSLIVYFGIHLRLYSLFSINLLKKEKFVSKS